MYLPPTAQTRPISVAQIPNQTTYTFAFSSVKARTTCQTTWMIFFKSRRVFSTCYHNWTLCVKFVVFLWTSNKVSLTHWDSQAKLLFSEEYLFQLWRLNCNNKTLLEVTCKSKVDYQTWIADIYISVHKSAQTCTNWKSLTHDDGLSDKKRYKWDNSIHSVSHASIMTYSVFVIIFVSNSLCWFTFLNIYPPLVSLWLYFFHLN